MAAEGNKPWYEHSKNIEGVLLDISGVLYDSGEDGGTPIEGSVEAVNSLKASGVPVRFCTNETTVTKENIVNKLKKFGFDMRPSEVFPPSPAVCQVLSRERLRPHLLIHKDVESEFADCDTSNPNCVVIGDAAESFSYQNLNKAFQVLIGMDNPRLIAMGKGKYYKETDGLKLDVGTFMTALEFAADLKAEIVGKPSKLFFMGALNDMGVKPENALMIGDDIVNDVGGAQACGMRGLQVRTGKFRPQDEHHPTVRPDGYVDNLAQAVDLFLQHR